jgi:(E)-4-hydroxy-3-methylbut-2-enyl-diphosphate synthase
MKKVYCSQAVSIGDLTVGGGAPVRIQSMTNTDTNDVPGSVAQCEKMIHAGAELVRLTTQGNREVENLGRIRQQLQAKGFHTPVVADIHFRPALALEAAKVAHKIRINPGNYLSGGSVEDLLPGLLQTCRQYGTAIRIGVNHGSLHEKILSDYGNTPEGMVASAMGFLYICRDHQFRNVVVSMKSSNPVVMVESVRLLVHRMRHEGMSYPLHLGVTEAGDGVEGRIRSVVGIAPLLLEGMGDTIRVSLTEPPEAELPVAKKICLLFPRPDLMPYDPFNDLAWDPFRFNRRKSRSVSGIGNGSAVKIISTHPPDPEKDEDPRNIETRSVTYEQWNRNPGLMDVEDRFLLLEQGDLSIQEIKNRLSLFCARDQVTPVIFKTISRESDPDLFSMLLAGELGSLLVDGCIDAIWVENPKLDHRMINDTLLMILQAAGARISKTEYIACPSCGRTHFDILTRLKEIRRATSHLPSLKIGVMGCIVNGPGEMADAHYGYVGSGPGRVTLYMGRHPVEKNLPEEEALEALITLMKREGDWKDP